MSGKNFMSFGDADTILTEFSNDIKSRVSTKANQGLTAQQKANAKTNIGIEKVPNVATNDQTPTFLEESTRTNIASGDKLSLIFGKIKKFFSDLKTVAFTGSYNDLSDTPDLSLKADKTDIDSVYSVMGQNGAKNLIPYPYYHTSKTTAGITVTDNGDGTLTFDGTSTSSAVIFRLTNNDTNIEIPLNKDKYILTWVDSSEHKRYFRIDIALVKSDETTITVNGELGVINIDNTNGEYKGIYAVTVWSGNNQTVSNLTFKPMLRLAADINDDTYVQYAMTNKQLTDEIATKAGISDVPTALSQLIADSTHRVVTDTEKSTWNGKANKKTTMDSYYGTSSTAADTAAKVITVTDDGGNFSLRAGIAIMVKFSAQNTAQNPTFNVNNTGAKSVYYNNAVVTTGNLWAGGNTRPARYVYDGTYWVWMGQAIDQNTTYSAMSKAELTTGTATTSRTVRADYLKAGIEELIDGTMAVPKYDATNRREYYEGGSAFSGNIDSSPTAGSNNAVASGGTKTYVDNAVSRLNDEIAKQVVTVTKTSAVTSNSGIVAYICNNFCFVAIDANILSGAADGTVLATGFTKPIYFNAIGRTNKAFDIMINSSGELIIKGTPTTGWVQGSISYMI